MENRFWNTAFGKPLLGTAFGKTASDCFSYFLFVGSGVGKVRGCQDVEAEREFLFSMLLDCFYMSLSVAGILIHGFFSIDDFCTVLT